MNRGLLHTVLALAVGLTATGCYRQQMAKQPSFHNPDQPSEFFADGQANRPLQPGVVARGTLQDDKPEFTGKDGERYLDAPPTPITMPLLERGQERFNIYCSMCHGRVGRGDGQVVARGYLKPPSLHDERLRTMPAGRIFEIVTQGFGAMPSYSSQIPVGDRWAIIAYVRALQLSQNVPADKLTPEERRKLEDASRAR